MVRTRHIHCCGLGGQSLVEELRSRTPHGAAKLKKKKKERKRDHLWLSEVGTGGRGLSGRGQKV